MASDTMIPESRVLAIASHVVHGYVGNKMATFVMQSLGCDVSAINTVHYSNHTAYKQVKGTKTSADQIQELYEGLRQSNLNSFDLLLTGYMPSAECVQAVGRIGRDIKFNAGTKPGSFFWVLDPVMGDNGKLYIPEDEVPEYKVLLREADLILPNQFEAELLSDTTITDLTSLAAAIQVLHKTYQVPHVIITSLRLTRDNHTLSSRAPSQAPSKPSSNAPSGPSSPRLDPATSHPQSWPTSSPPDSPESTSIPEIEEAPENLTIIGSTATSDHKPRLFRIDTPALPLFFSGTGDMFAALIIPRLIEAVVSSSTPALASKPSWRSPDDVKAEELPLAKACQKVLASMQSILATTTEKCNEEMARYDARAAKEGHGKGEEDMLDREKRRHLALMNASEVKVPRFIREINDPPNLERFRPRAVVEIEKLSEGVGKTEQGEGKAAQASESKLAGTPDDETKPEEKSKGNLDAKIEAKSAAKSDEETMHDTEGKLEEKPPVEKWKELKRNPEETLAKPEVQPEEKPNEISKDTSAESEDKSGEKVEMTSEDKSQAKSLEKELHSVEQ